MMEFIRLMPEAPGAPGCSVAVAILVQAQSGVGIHRVWFAVSVVVKPVAVIRPAMGSESVSVIVMTLAYASRNVGARDRAGAVAKTVMADADIPQSADAAHSHVTAKAAHVTTEAANVAPAKSTADMAAPTMAGTTAYTSARHGYRYPAGQRRGGREQDDRLAQHNSSFEQHVLDKQLNAPQEWLPTRTAINEAIQQIESSCSIVWPRLRSLSGCCAHAKRPMRLVTQVETVEVMGKETRGKRTARNNSLTYRSSNVTYRITRARTEQVAAVPARRLALGRSVENLFQRPKIEIALVVGALIPQLALGERSCVQAAFSLTPIHMRAALAQMVQLNQMASLKTRNPGLDASRSSNMTLRGIAGGRPKYILAEAHHARQ
jgi:hypothetical protein